MKPFVADLGSCGVVFTRAKYRLTAVVVDIIMRKPSHLLNRYYLRGAILIGLRAAGVPAGKASNLGNKCVDYYARSINAQCDALVTAPFGQKTERMIQAAFREDVIADLPQLSADLVGAIMGTRS